MEKQENKMETITLIELFQPHLLAEAEAAGKPLYIAWAYHRYHESLQPEEMKRLGDVREFTPVALLPGIEEQYDCRVVRWNGRR